MTTIAQEVELFNQKHCTTFEFTRELFLHGGCVRLVTLTNGKFDTHKKPQLKEHLWEKFGSHTVVVSSLRQTRRRR